MSTRTTSASASRLFSFGPPSSATRALASTAVVVASVVLALDYREAVGHWLGYAFVPLMVLSAMALHARSLGVQLFVRGLWWATSIGGALLGVAWAHSISGEAAAISALGTSAGLLLLGRSAALPDGRSAFFAPRAGRATFMLTVLLASTTSLTLAYFGLLSTLLAPECDTLALSPRFIDLAAGPEVGFLFLLAGLTGAGALGLFSMRAWAWVVATLATGVAGAMAAMGMLGLPSTVAAGLSVVGALVVVAQIPLLRRVFSGQRLTEPVVGDGRDRAQALVPALMLLALAGSAAATLLWSGGA